MFYLIIGENSTLIEEKITEIQSKFTEIPFSTLKNNTFESWLKKVESCDMFSPVGGIVNIEPKWLKQKEIVKEIENTITVSNQFGIPNIIIAKTIDKRSAVYKLFKKLKINEYQCTEFKDWEIDKVIDWIKSFCQKNNTTIDQTAIDLLINGYGTQLSIIKQELLKCMISILPNTTIKETDIKNSTGSALGFYNALSTAIKAGKINDIIKTTNSLMHLKETPHKIFNQILFQVNQLLPIALGLKEKKSSDEIASELGKHPYFIKKQISSIMKNPLAPKLRKMIPILAEIDIEIKSGKLTAKQGLIKLTTIIKYQI